MLFVVVALLVAALAVVLSISIGTSVSQLSQVSSQSKICNTAGCISAAHLLIQNMNQSVNPCDDFYQYACGGFIERVSIIEGTTNAQ